tara:strand:+ start:9009 stop:9836 length:828 start_codon:yes stop_codon:yes gene_type:complete
MVIMINFRLIIKKINKLKSNKAKNFFLKKKLLLKQIDQNKFKKSIHNLNSSQVKEKIKKKFYPNIEQLYFIYNIITIFKRVTVLEFGVGWSTKIISTALLENKKKYHKKIRNLRYTNSFELFSIDNYKKYLNKTKKSLDKDQKKITTFYYSDVKMSEFKKRICTEYEKLPKINPDLIFIDGPSQFKVKGKINNINTSHPDLAPISMDVVKIEPFLRPGTILLIDGRALNALFLKNFFYRNWNYKYFRNYDLHFFFLNGPTLGLLNERQLKFYKIK